MYILNLYLIRIPIQLMDSYLLVKRVLVVRAGTPPENHPEHHHHRGHLRGSSHRSHLPCCLHLEVCTVPTWSFRHLEAGSIYLVICRYGIYLVFSGKNSPSHWEVQLLPSRFECSYLKVLSHKIF
jgi:hypothetical protein